MGLTVDDFEFIFEATGNFKGYIGINKNRAWYYTKDILNIKREEFFIWGEFRSGLPPKPWKDVTHLYRKEVEEDLLWD